MLKNGTATSEQKSERLLDMSIKVAHLPSDIAHTNAIHEAQDRTIQPSEQARNRSSTRLASIFSQRHITPPMEPIFDGPVIPDEVQQALWRGLLHRKTAQSIDYLMAQLASVEEAHGAFEPKDLLDAFPLLAEPVIEVRATSNLAMLQPSMPFVPGLSLVPAATIGGAILKQISNILVESQLVVLGNQHIIPHQPMDLCTQGALGMHGIQGEDAPLDQ